MNNELKTPAEREREKRNEAIRRDYRQMCATFPEIRSWRIYRSIAETYGLSVMQIRNVILAES